MKLENKNTNYCATVIRIQNLISCDGLDNLVALPFFGYSALVNKEHQIGDIGLFFTTETQLSKDFMYHNNLNRGKILNKDIDESGYIDKRIKSIKLKGNISTALFMPLSSLEYLGIDTNQFKEGDSFTHVNDIEVCKKYVIRLTNEKGNKTRYQNKRFERIDNKLFPEYIDTDNYFKNKDRYKNDDEIIASLKIHGSSARFTNQKVLRKLSRLEKVLKYFGVKINDTEYDVIAGSRRVIKDTKSNKQNDNYYSTDLWNENLQKIAHLIPKNVCLYGELVGWCGQSPIQKNYTYQIPQGQNQLYIYRITTVNEDGFELIWSWDNMIEWCEKNGLKTVPVMWRGKHKDFKVDDFLNIKYFENGFSQALPLDNGAPCDEGLVIRGDGMIPYVTKAKSPNFFIHETKQLDSGQIDMETEESVVDTE